MARLNEPPQPAVESIDALKRRFVRQNREIARANSTQSLRIRNLESEVSRLLSENVSLREQIIRLHYEVEKNTSRAVQNNVDRVRAKLDAKLTELGGLVQELGKVQDNVESQRWQKRKSISRASPKQSPDQKNWKNALTLSEVTGGADGRLPPIVEDKYYPRRTLDAGELYDNLADPANITDSPDLGPPPVAHFEDGDPIKFDSSNEKPEVEGPSGNADEVQPMLSANLETRKKRRESSHHRDAGDRNSNAKPSQEATQKDPTATIDQPLKSGAKRKLHVHDEEDQPRRSEDEEKIAFQFSRKASESRLSETNTTKPKPSKTSKLVNERVSQNTAANIQSRRDKSIDVGAMPNTTNRKVLGPKSVNADPVNSPVKLKGNSKDKVAEAKDDLAKLVRERNRPKDKAQPSKRITSTKVEAPEIAGTEVVKPAEPPPETPAPLLNDFFSPLASEPSAPRPASQDTPPPADLGPDTGTGSFGRASRRPRGSVNYAQPNLRDKMRRPTAELIDAVGAEERARQARAERETSGSMVIKQEESIDALPFWKAKDPQESQRTREEPTSPLVNKTAGTAADLSSNVITERRRRTIVPARNVDADDRAKPPSGASSAIAALTAGSHKSKRQEEGIPNHANKREEEIRAKVERLSIYDFTGSSPADRRSDEGIEEPTMPTRSSRRHSSVPSASERQGKGSIIVSRRGDRRRESMLYGKHEENSEQAGGPSLSRGRSVIEPNAGGEESAMGRGERAASRRRSMML